jgi:hypothetical protein
MSQTAGLMSFETCHYRDKLLPMQAVLEGDCHEELR